MAARLQDYHMSGTPHEIPVSWREIELRFMTETLGANPKFLVVMTEDGPRYKGLQPL